MTWSGGAAGPPPTTWAAGADLPPIPPAVPRRHGAGGVLFTVLLGLALLVGTGVMALVLLASGRPDALAVGLVLAVLPVPPLVAVYLWLDRYEPEPLRLLASAFAWGALVATSVALLLQYADQVVNGSSEEWSAVVMAPVTEEATKGLFVLLLVWARRHHLDGMLDALVYAGLVGVGFAFTENVLYFAGAYTGGPDFGEGGIDAATGLFVLRGVLSPFAHPLFTSAVGLGVGLLVVSRNPLRFLAPVAGYVVAVVAHAAWNGAAYLDEGRYFLVTYLLAMLPGFFALAGLAVWFRVREGRMLARSLTDLARHGYLAPDEVPWLARLSARRTARSNAALRGGPMGERMMRDYQEQAIELAMLHDRVMRGRAPDDAATRGSLMTHRLAVLRAHLMLPAHADLGWPQHREGWS